MDRTPSIAYIPRSYPDSEKALERALGLARAAGVPLTVLSTGDTVMETRVVEAAAGGVPVELRRISRRMPMPTAVQQALPEGTALVIKVSEGGDEDDEPFAVPDRFLLRALPCSLWIVPAGLVRRSRVVLAALDLADDGEGVDRAVLQMASTLAEWEGAHLHVVHAWSLTGESIVACPVRGVGPARAREVLNRAREERVTALKALMASAGVGHAGWTLGKGTPSKVIRKAVRRTGADVLVTGYRGRKGLWGLVQGNLAESFLDTPGLGLLFVRPDAPALTGARRESARTA